MLDDADVNITLSERRHENEIEFHHKSFVDFLLDPSRPFEYCLDMEEMNTRLAFASMKTFSLQPTPSRIACGTFPFGFTSIILIPHTERNYATFCRTHPSHRQVRYPPASIVTSIDIFRPICMFLRHFKSRRNEIWITGCHKMISFPPLGLLQ